MKLPLRLTLSFHRWEKSDGDFLFIFNKILPIKLFTLEIEFDQQSFYVFITHQDTLSINAFHKTLILKDILAIKKAAHLSNFDTVFEIPFFLSITETKEILSEIKKMGYNKLSISYFITKYNLEQFREILDFACDYGIKKIIVPNPDLVNNGPLLTKSFLIHNDLRKLDFLKNYTDKLNFQIHDYFLAKYLGLKDAELFKGCQAGTLMGYIDNGIVYPCKSIPIYLGSLFEEDFATIWERAENVMINYHQPTQCKECEAKDNCKLGCPGTAFFLNCGRKDPLCEK